MMVKCPIAQLKDSDDLAIISREEDISYRDLNQRVNAAMYWCIHNGIKPGDRICFHEKNSLELIILALALFRIGAVFCPISPRIPQESYVKMEKQIDASQSLLNLSEIFEEMDLEAERELSEQILLDQDASIIFSSGSTGKSKAILHSYNNHYYSALGANHNMPLKPGNRWLLSLPIFHVGGLSILFRSFFAGSTVVLHDPAIAIPEMINDFQISHISMVPTQLLRVIDSAYMKLPKVILIGGAPMPDMLREKIIKKRLPVYTTYGSTEMCSQITTTNANDIPDRLNTSGRLLLHRELKLAKSGEILVKGNSLCKGYINKDELTSIVDADGWYHTKDLGQLDDDGYLNVLGRMDNMFISGGENIYPERIEQALKAIDTIEEAIVVAISHEEFGERPIAFLKGDWLEFELIQKLELGLARFEIPDRFEAWPEEVANDGLKVNRTGIKNYVQNKYHKH